MLASLAVIIVTDSLTDQNWRDCPFILFDSSVSLRRMILHLTLFTNFVFLSKSVNVWTDFQSCSKKAWLISEGCPSCTYMTYFVSIKLANVAKKSCASVTVVLLKVSGAFSPLCCVLVGSWPAWWFGSPIPIQYQYQYTIPMAGLMVWITRRLAGDTGAVVNKPTCYGSSATLLLGGSKHNPIFVAVKEFQNEHKNNTF